MTNTAALLERVVLIARKNLGYGETSANNRGPFIDAIGGAKLSAKNPAWCALFAGYCYRRACEALGISHPDWLYRSMDVPEPGALRLVNGMANSSRGRSFKNPGPASPGDLILWKRTGGHHVGIVEHVTNGLVHTIEGNVGPYPAKVRRLVHDVFNEPHFVKFASLAIL